MKCLRKIFGATSEQKSRDNADSFSSATADEIPDADSFSPAARAKIPDADKPRPADALSDERRARREGTRAAQREADAERWRRHLASKPGSRT